MPTEIVIVRHGLCTGNAADRASSKGDHSLYTQELRSQNSTDWPLLLFGVEQAKKAGEKIRSSVSEHFDHYITSDIMRSVETSQNLGFQKSVWETNALLRERSWGGVENFPYPERIELFRQSGISPEEDSLEWQPPNGESMLFILRQMKEFLNLAQQKYYGEKLLIVSHGAPLQAMRIIQHEVDPNHYASFIGGSNYIRNCHIFHYFSKIQERESIPRYLFEKSLFLENNGEWSESIQKIK